MSETKTEVAKVSFRDAGLTVYLREDGTFAADFVDRNGNIHEAYSDEAFAFRLASEINILINRAEWTFV